AAPRLHRSPRLAGTHTWQRAYGCDLLEDGTVSGFYRSAYDGRDFFTLDMDTMTFLTWDTVAEVAMRDKMEAERWKNFLEITCIEWLRRYLRSGRDALARKEHPMVRVSGKETQGFLTLRCRVY
ncbi:HA1F protein, partial [Centropus bengalensis]|nr:HA1F protein [Centropus bengalensis]